MHIYNFNALLVPVNFSPCSLNALDTAIAICKQFGSKLTLLQVIENSKAIGLHKSESLPLPLSNLARNARNNLKTLCLNLYAHHGIESNFAIETGIPANVICSMAVEKRFDLIVLGQQTKSLHNFLLGSTGYRVIKNSPCPVMSVPSNGKHSVFRKIMFPIRNAPNMLEKYFLVRPLAIRNSASIILSGVSSMYNEEAYRRVTILLDEIRSNAKRDELDYSTHIHFCESISREVLEQSKKENADMIVITSMVIPSFKRFFLDHYTKNIVRNAGCPVLSLRADISPSLPVSIQNNS